MPTPRTVRWICVLAGAVLSLAARHRMNADGLSYIDMAASGDVFHGYWSPLLAILLRPLMALAGPESEFAAAHLVMWLAFLAALSGMTRLVGERPFFYLLLFYAAARLISFTQVTPDMLVLAAVLLIASENRPVWTGVWLAAGFLAKTVMLPAGILFLLIRRRFALAAAVFAALAAGPIWRISSAAGHPSIGDSGRLNYAWFVNGMQPYSGWIAADEHGAPEHPPRVLASDPLTIEYAEPVGGTYPLWYDPSYWYAGTRTPVHAERLLRAIARNVREVLRLLLIETAPITAAILAMAWFARGRWSLPREKLWMVIWPLSVIALYCCVLVEARYVAPFLLVLWMALFEAFRVEPARERAILAAAAIAILLPLSLRSAEEVRAGFDPPEHLEVARVLRQAGVSEGSRVAAVGLANDFFAVRTVRARVVAEVRDTERFWSRPADPDFESRLTGLGARVLIGTDRPRFHPDTGWKRAGETRFWIKRLEPAPR